MAADVPDPAPADPHPPRLPLASVRVIDATDEYGAYAGRLLADLGADVVRVEPPDGDPLRRREPLMDTPAGPVSAFGWFVNLNKRSVVLDLGSVEGHAGLLGLLATADVLLDPWRPTDLARLGLGRASFAAACPDLVRVTITPYGSDGPLADRPATDLTSLASGGLLSLGGYPDAEPVAVHGGQSLLAASLFGAVAALVGLIGRAQDREGRHLDVSAQEAVAAALEDSIPQFDLTGRVRRRAGDLPREAGTGIYACADGYVSMVAGRLGTAKAWTALTHWLVEEGIPDAEELLTPPWQEFPYRQRRESIDRFRVIFERFTRPRTRERLYREAQRRSIALAPVNQVGDLFADAQLAARDFFREVTPVELGRPVAVPGRPYRLDGDRGPAPRPAPAAPASNGAADGRLPAADGVHVPASVARTPVGASDAP
jgi:benzylsuccinate CoA-transferase BbsE subunit